MTDISWNEVQKRATEFAAKWKNETYERGESQSFWSEFLDVFGVDRKRQGAFFEYPVKKLGGKQGFIDMFWPGMLLAEQKSGGRDLSAANTQAFDYLHGLSDDELPKYIIVSDFKRFTLINQETREKTDFTLADFAKRVKLFGFLIGRDSENPQEEDPVNRKAAEAMAKLHNRLRDSNYTGHALETLLVRLMFCLFADDANIFERGSFESYLRNRTNQDGSDLGSKLSKIFEVLNTPEGERQTTLDDDLAALPYVNGGLFAELTRMPDFTSDMRSELINACDLDWSQVSPAIFGSMFQGVMDTKARRNLGAHYTSERNIMKVIKPLLLDALYEEFEKVKRSKPRLKEFHDKLATLTFLDPACGCGNFLVITYRELRKLEHEVLKAIHGRQALLTDVTDSIKVNVDQMYGIEIEEFPALIAQTALWLTDHQMNLAASAQFGRHFSRLPLTKTAKIVHGNALTLDWRDIITPVKLSYILGNPPFIGSKLMTAEQREDLLQYFDKKSGAGVLDFVSAWYAKAADFMAENKNIETALVSTNSITQGEQVAILWEPLLEKGIHINFAHRTFRWTNEGAGNAAVHCVIIGFSYQNDPNKTIFSYETLRSEPTALLAKNISPYLFDGPNTTVSSRSKQLYNAPAMTSGNKPIDGGHYIFATEEKESFLSKNPEARKYFKKFIGAEEFLNNKERWILWLGAAEPSELRQFPALLERVQMVRAYRASSKSKPTQKIASVPTRFHTEFIPENNYLVLPEVSSENREYIPVGFMDVNTFCSNKMRIIPDGTLYHFGILMSKMHMAWVDHISGRLKSDYQYSAKLVYNNFPWPENVIDAQKAEIERLAQAILNARAEFPNSSLADLYDPRTMPPVLAEAHQALDRAVDKFYQSKSFKSDSERVALLFEEYSRIMSL